MKKCFLIFLNKKEIEIRIFHSKNIEKSNNSIFKHCLLKSVYQEGFFFHFYTSKQTGTYVSKNKFWSKTMGRKNIYKLSFMELWNYHFSKLDVFLHSRIYYKFMCDCQPFTAF